MNYIEIIFAILLTIIGSFFGFYLNRKLDKIHLPKITTARKKAISGNWVGVYKQEINKEFAEKNIPITLTLSAGNRVITGFASVVDINKYKFNLEGGFCHNKYLRLNYMASGIAEGAIDFGSIFLIVGDYPNKISGKIVGYGSASETLISGVIELTKQ